ncbi:14672_t:CDS:1, partial [Acaulospora colombiana]
MSETRDSTLCFRNARELNTKEEYGESSSVDFERNTCFEIAPDYNRRVERVCRSEKFGCEKDLDSNSEKITDPISDSIETDNINENFTNTHDDRMCRICFAGPEEEDNLGRLISPCLCKGTMR